MLKSFLSGIKDNRRKEGRRYESGHILLFTIFAIVSGADSYRKVHTFIRGNYETLSKEFGLKWKRIPAYTTIRNIIRGLSVPDSEECFRKYSLELSELPEEMRDMIFIACDGKTLRGSFDNFHDKKAIHILSAFLSESGIIPAHCEVGEKTLKAAKENNNDVIVCVRGNQK